MDISMDIFMDIPYLRQAWFYHFATPWRQETRQPESKMAPIRKVEADWT